MWPVVNDGHRACASYVTPLRRPCQQAPRPPTGGCYCVVIVSVAAASCPARPGHQAPPPLAAPELPGHLRPSGSDPSGRRLASAHCHARRCSTLRPAHPRQPQAQPQLPARQQQIPRRGQRRPAAGRPPAGPAMSSSASSSPARRTRPPARPGWSSCVPSSGPGVWLKCAAASADPPAAHGPANPAAGPDGLPHLPYRGRTADTFGVPTGGTKPKLRIVAHVRTGSRRWIGAAIGGYHDGCIRRAGWVKLRTGTDSVRTSPLPARLPDSDPA